MGGGGQTPSTTVQQTKQSNEPPAYIQPYLQKGIQDLTALYDKGQAPGYYPGATVAAPSANTQAALSALYERGVRGSPYGKSIMANLNETMGGKYLDVDANPYFQKALAAGFRPQNEQFMQEVLPGLEGRFALSGRYGSGAHTGTTDRAVDSLTRAQADAAAKASSGAYDAERSRMLGAAGTAAGLFPQLQAADYQDINAMGQAGAGWDQQNQARIDSDIARYNYDANKDWNYINRYLASLNAGYPGGEMSGTMRGSAMPSTNPSADMWNTIFKGVGTALPFFMASRQTAERGHRARGQAQRRPDRLQLPLQGRPAHADRPPGAGGGARPPRRRRAPSQRLANGRLSARDTPRPRREG